MTAKNEIRDMVRERYGALAESSSSCCGVDTSPSCGCQGSEGLERLGYTAEQTASVPEGANLGLGCGNPLAHAEVRRGETVLDLGSGAGIDAFLAAREVGPEGRVIGVDMTPAMITLARNNAKEHEFANVEFRLGEIEHLPVADASVDLIISNCVINLSPEKEVVFREAYRVLKPGGRMLVSDLVLTRPLPDSVRKSVEAYVGCVAGASMREDYLKQIREAGFGAVEVVSESSYGCDEASLPEPVRTADAASAVQSVKVRAVKAPAERTIR